MNPPAETRTASTSVRFTVLPETEPVTRLVTIVPPPVIDGITAVPEMLLPLWLSDIVPLPFALVSVTVQLPVTLSAEGAVVPAAWVTVTDRPAMLTDPVRAAPVLALTRKVTVPGPLPLAPDVIVTNPELLPAVHEQTLSTVTETV